LCFPIKRIASLYCIDIAPTRTNKNARVQPSRWWLSGKNLGSRGLLPLWSQVQALWLLIWWPLEAYMVVNFRARGISRGARKLARTLTLNSKKKKCTRANYLWPRDMVSTAQWFRSIEKLCCCNNGELING